MTATVGVARSGNQEIDGVLSGIRWNAGSLTYSFPTSASDYPSFYGSGEPTNGFSALNATQRTFVTSTLAQYASVMNLTFSLTSGGSGELRFAETNATSTAWAYYPSTNAIGGDSWYRSAGGTYDTPAVGNYAAHTFIHEIGHALGLKHGHEAAGYGALSAAHDSLEYSVMTYRSYEGAALSGYTYETWGGPQSLMQNDIATLQYMYGANFNFHTENTVYSWSASTGQQFVNGVAQDAPGSNRIFMTLWDGGGTDTYDFSNYTTRLNVNLEPGAWTTTSNAQLARLHYNGSVVADGNIANALLYNGDVRSLIENAVGGSADDVIRGNSANNSFSGNSGNDDLYGFAGNDSLSGGAGADYIDGGAGNDTAVYSGAAANYSYTKSGVYWIVSDLRGGSPEATDYLVNVENLQFSDSTVVLPSNLFVGTASAEVLRGTDGADTLDARGGNDDLFGFGGNDTLIGGAGADYIDGGAGDDTAVYSGTAADYSYTKSGAYWIVSDLRSGSPEATDYLINTENFRFSDTTVVLSQLGLTGTNGADVIRGTDGADTLDAGGGNDDLYGFGGNDTLIGGTGADYIDGGAGDDTAVYSGAAADYSYTKSGAYWIVSDLRSGSPEATDYLINTENFRFSDTTVVLSQLGLTGTNGAEVIRGTDGADTLDARGGNDDLYGLGGNDTLIGGAGADYIDGGAGNDTAVYSGAAANFNWAKNGVYWVVSDLRGGSPEATDYLINVENLQFTDSTVSLPASVSDGFVFEDHEVDEFPTHLTATIPPEGFLI